MFAEVLSLTAAVHANHTHVHRRARLLQKRLAAATRAACKQEPVLVQVVPEAEVGPKAAVGASWPVVMVSKLEGKRRRARRRRRVRVTGSSARCVVLP